MSNDSHEKRYLDLAEKWLNGTLTPGEEKEYADWYNSIGPGEKIEIPAATAADREQYRALLLSRINTQKSRTIPARKRYITRIAAAAAVIGVLVSSYFIINTRTKSIITPAVAVASKDIAPVAQGVTLKTAGGKIIRLDTAGNGTLVNADNERFIKNENGLSVSNTGAGSSLSYNELMTAKGSQQQVTLADGTKVFLNAASSLRFPTAFTSAERLVEITGEAYFEVAKDRNKPFIVIVNNSEIKVLGTHFNVRAYANENALQTTLLEGSVQFRDAGKQVVLKPGEQAQLNETGEIKLLSHADTEQAVAWKNGLLSFSNAGIKTIMRDIERWYDVTVEYNGAVPPGTFSGEITRTAKLSEVLKVFEISKINFNIDAEHRKLTVMP